MLSYLLFVVSLVNHSGFVIENKNVELIDEGGATGGLPTGGLIVKMGPVLNVRIADVRVFSAGEMEAEATLPAIAEKGSLFESFSRSPLRAIRYGN
jgi:hypothetical protein